MFNPEKCLEEKADKEHIKICKFITCRKCHDVNAVNKALEQNDKLSLATDATPKEIRDDRFCRMFRANIESRVDNNNKIHDYYTLLQNVGSLNKKYLLTKEQYKQFTRIEI